MSLESRRDEARSLLTAFFKSIMSQPARWYGVMFPRDHPYSFSQLLDLSTEDKNGLLLDAGFVKHWGKENQLRFQRIVFEQFLSENVDLQQVEICNFALEEYKLKRFAVFLIGTLPLHVSFDFE